MRYDTESISFLRVGGVDGRVYWPPLMPPAPPKPVRKPRPPRHPKPHLPEHQESQPCLFHSPARRSIKGKPFPSHTRAMGRMSLPHSNGPIPRKAYNRSPSSATIPMRPWASGCIGSSTTYRRRNGSCPKGCPQTKQLDDGTRQGINDSRKIGYNGPRAASRESPPVFLQALRPGRPGFASAWRHEAAAPGCHEGACAGRSGTDGEVQTVAFLTTNGLRAAWPQPQDPDFKPRNTRNTRKFREGRVGLAPPFKGYIHQSIIYKS